ncbi:MAG: hypothetical protein K2G30_10430 [Muribaculaceae bacterium]|nr:hypothetical protein [Muribaculaceae bacterium]
MKKKILSLAIVAMSFAAFGTMAQTTASQNNGKACATEQCAKAGKSVKAANPFDGLNITDAQKAQLQQLNTSRREERKAQTEARKADRQRGDSARIAQRRADKKEYLEQVKAIVGPEQYVVFLENFYVNGGGRQRQGGKAAVGQGRMSKIHAMRQGDRVKGGKKGDRVLKAQSKVSNASAQASAN